MMSEETRKMIEDKLLTHMVAISEIIKMHEPEAKSVCVSVRDGYYDLTTYGETPEDTPRMINFCICTDDIPFLMHHTPSGITVDHNAPVCDMIEAKVRSFHLDNLTDAMTRMVHAYKDGKRVPVSASAAD